MGVVTIRKEIEKLFYDNAGNGKLFADTLSQQSDFNFEKQLPDLTKFPVAVIVSPSVTTSERLTNANNERTYDFNITVIHNLPEQQSTGQVDSVFYEIDFLKEQVLDLIDKAGNLNGMAIGDLEPSVSPSVNIKHGDEEFVVFYVSLIAKDVVSSI